MQCSSFEYLPRKRKKPSSIASSPSTSKLSSRDKGDRDRSVPKFVEQEFRSFPCLGLISSLRGRGASALPVTTTCFLGNRPSASAGSPGILLKLFAKSCIGSFKAGNPIAVCTQVQPSRPGLEFFSPLEIGLFCFIQILLDRHIRKNL